MMVRGSIGSRKWMIVRKWRWWCGWKGSFLCYGMKSDCRWEVLGLLWRGKGGCGSCVVGWMEHDCAIREANRESVFTVCVDANTEMGRMQMRNEAGCAVWGCNVDGCVCLKKQKNSFEYIGTTGWCLQSQGSQDDYCENIACACIQMISMGESPSLVGDDCSRLVGTSKRWNCFVITNRNSKIITYLWLAAQVMLIGIAGSLPKRRFMFSLKTWASRDQRSRRRSRRSIREDTWWRQWFAQSRAAIHSSSSITGMVTKTVS